MTKVAVFDLDGTILYKTTAERELILFLISKRIIKPTQILLFLYDSLRRVLSGKFNSLRQDKYYLCGLGVNELELLLPQFCHNRLQRSFSPVVVNQVHQLKSQSYLIILLSGAPQIILQHLQSLLPIDFFIGTRLEVKDGKFTGRIEDVYPYGKDKVAVFRKFFAETGVDYANSYAFANRYSDVPLLELFGHPFAAHPDKKLLHYARQKTWGIIQ